MFMRSMIFFLYAIQALFYGFYLSLPLTYTQIPDYQTLSIFAAAGLPYSLKFLMAPFLQRFYFKRYGKRKTWIIFSLLAMIIISFLISKVVGRNQYQFEAAVLLMLSLFASALKDVSTDALAVETIDSGSAISTISYAAQEIGKTVSLSIFLALISHGYWSNFGIHDAIISGETFLQGVSVFILISAIVIHFVFKESDFVKQEKEQSQQSFIEIIKHYKYFFLPRYQLCRLGLLLLLSYQGVSFYVSTYQYQLIKDNYVDRQTLMFVADVSFIPSILACYFIGKAINKDNMYLHYSFFRAIHIVICLMVYFWQIQQKAYILFSSILIKVASSIIYYLNVCLINEVCKGIKCAINVTALLSLMNLGYNTSIQNVIIFIIGYENAMKVGFLIGFLTILSMPNLCQWIKSGEKLKDSKNQ